VRPYAAAERWSNVLHEEWTNQVRLEKYLEQPASLTAAAGDEMKQAEVQIGFITTFAQPLFNALCPVIPEMQAFSYQCSVNYQMWLQRLDDFRKTRGLAKEDPLNLVGNYQWFRTAFPLTLPPRLSVHDYLHDDYDHIRNSHHPRCSITSSVYPVESHVHEFPAVSHHHLSQHHLQPLDLDTSCGATSSPMVSPIYSTHSAFSSSVSSVPVSPPSVSSEASGQSRASPAPTERWGVNIVRSAFRAAVRPQKKLTPKAPWHTLVLPLPTVA